MAYLLGRVCFLWSDRILHRHLTVVDSLLFLSQGDQSSVHLSHNDHHFFFVLVHLLDMVFCTMGELQWVHFDIQQCYKKASQQVREAN